MLGERKEILRLLKIQIEERRLSCEKLKAEADRLKAENDELNSRIVQLEEELRNKKPTVRTTPVNRKSSKGRPAEVKGYSDAAVKTYLPRTAAKQTIYAPPLWMDMYHEPPIHI